MILDEIIDEVNNCSSLEEAIDLAIEREIEAKKFYSEKAKAVRDPVIKDLYNFLAEEEADHEAYLRAFKVSKKYPSFEEKEHNFIKTQSFDPEFVEDNDKLTYIEILIASMRHERKSEYFYTELSKKFQDPEQKKFFETLAHYERQHYELIDGLLDSETAFRMQT